MFENLNIVHLEVKSQGLLKLFVYFITCTDTVSVMCFMFF